MEALALLLITAVIAYGAMRSEERFPTDGSLFGRTRGYIQSDLSLQEVVFTQKLELIEGRPCPVLRCRGIRHGDDGARPFSLRLRRDPADLSRDVSQLSHAELELTLASAAPRGGGATPRGALSFRGLRWRSSGDRAALLLRLFSPETGGALPLQKLGVRAEGRDVEITVRAASHITWRATVQLRWLEHDPHLLSALLDALGSWLELTDSPALAPSPQELCALLARCDQLVMEDLCQVLWEAHDGPALASFIAQALPERAAALTALSRAILHCPEPRYTEREALLVPFTQLADHASPEAWHDELRLLGDHLLEERAHDVASLARGFWQGSLHGGVRTRRLLEWLAVPELSGQEWLTLREQCAPWLTEFEVAYMAKRALADSLLAQRLIHFVSGLGHDGVVEKVCLDRLARPMHVSDSEELPRACALLARFGGALTVAALDEELSARWLQRQTRQALVTLRDALAHRHAVGALSVASTREGKISLADMQGELRVVEEDEEVRDDE